MNPWTLLYVAADVLSCASSAAIVAKLLRHRHQPVQGTTVYWVLVWFFANVALWSLFRALFILIVVTNDQLEKHAQADAVGERNPRTQPLTDWHIIGVRILGDTMLIGTSLWLLVMTRELYKLAKTSMDRGAKRERVVTKRYVVVVHLLLAANVVIELAQTLCQRQYTADVSYIVILGTGIQFLGLVSVTLALLLLKCNGRHVESVHGRFVPSPLYLRIRNIMIVFAVFSLQHHVRSLIFMAKEDHLGTQWWLGTSALMFRSLGLAMTFVLGCSLECVVQSCRCALPTEYTDTFSSMHESLLQFTAQLELPRENPVFVFTDIESSSALWALEDQSIMQSANAMHDDILRTNLLKYNGYEITTAGDSFQLAFASIKDAVEYCAQVQEELLVAKWPRKLRNCGIPGASRVHFGGKKIFEGLRVRMGIHDANEQADGTLVTAVHQVTGRITYTGLSEVLASKIGDLGQGGQVLMTSRVAQWVQDHGTTLRTACSVEFVGRFFITSVTEEMQVHQLVIHGLEARRDFYRQMPMRRPDSFIKLSIAEFEAFEFV